MVILTDGVSTYPKICEAPNQWNEARYQVFKYLPTFKPNLSIRNSTPSNLVLQYQFQVQVPKFLAKICPEASQPKSGLRSKKSKICPDQEGIIQRLPNSAVALPDPCILMSTNQEFTNKKPSSSYLILKKVQSY